MNNEKPLITGKTKLLGVIGYPVEHSLSPVMHNAAIAHLGLDYIYIPFAIKPEDLAIAMQSFRAIGVAGFNATIPHKQAILPLLAEISPIAKTVGAVNTVIYQDDRWMGTNTDVEGFLAPLLTHNRDWSQTSAVILGIGGAARAVVAACAEISCAAIYVVGRNLQKLQEFSQSWKDSKIINKLHIYPWEELHHLISKANLLINTTPIGMYPKIDESPLTLEEMADLPSGAIAYDLTYNPSPTKFLQQAQKQDAVIIDGLEMLIQQGAAALKIWLDLENVPVDVMRLALQKHLNK